MVTARADQNRLTDVKMTDWSEHLSPSSIKELSFLEITTLMLPEIQWSGMEVSNSLLKFSSAEPLASTRGYLLVITSQASSNLAKIINSAHNNNLNLFSKITLFAQVLSLFICITVLTKMYFFKWYSRRKIPWYFKSISHGNILITELIQLRPGMCMKDLKCCQTSSMREWNDNELWQIKISLSNFKT